MANNRIYLRCRACGETLFLGKHFFTPFHYYPYDGERLEDKLKMIEYLLIALIGALMIAAGCLL